MKQAVIVFVLLVVCGCSAIPFQKPVLVDMSLQNTMDIRDRFSKRVPEKFNLLNNIIFKYNFSKKISALGSITAKGVDEFTVVCINPLGVKLFEIYVDKNGTHNRFSIGKLRNKNIAKVVGEDIKRIYFNLVPSEDASVKTRRYKIIFSQNSESGKLLYIFGGKNGYLLEKKFYENVNLSWRVSYYEYRLVDNNLYPSGIIFDNYKYGYQLIVKLKEVFNEQD